MKSKFFALTAITLFFLSSAQLFAKEEEIIYQPYELDKLIHEIETPSAPVITDDYVIFTADTNNRYVGIAFDFENYQTIHPFTLLNSENEDGEKKPSMLFYCYERTHKLNKIKYRLIMDGLWTTDPLNKNKDYDDNVNLYFSYVEDNTPIYRNTEITKQDCVHFIYKGKEGQSVHLTGNFTNWDPWIYQLAETSPGFYELNLPLTSGKYYYNYYVGLTPVLDNTNPNKEYTTDGRSVNVITVN